MDIRKVFSNKRNKFLYKFVCYQDSLSIHRLEMKILCPSTAFNPFRMMNSIWISSLIAIFLSPKYLILLLSKLLSCLDSVSAAKFLSMRSQQVLTFSSIFLMPKAISQLSAPMTWLWQMLCALNRKSRNTLVTNPDLLPAGQKLEI